MSPRPFTSLFSHSPVLAAVLFALPASASVGDAAFLRQESARVDQSVQQAQRALAEARAELPAAFDAAYARYPRLPEGVLEAVAFVGSRWVHRIPEAAVSGHHGLPQTYGVMGLYAGNGDFRDVLGEAARTLGVPRARVIADPRTQILATAALLDRFIAEAGLTAPALEDLVGPLARLSGLPLETEVHRFARNSYAYDVLLTLDRGHDDHGILIPQHPILWDLAFDDDTLTLLRAPLVRIDPDADRVEADTGSVRGTTFGTDFAPADSSDDGKDTDADSARTGSSLRTSPTATTPQSTDYPPALWVASPNYSSRNGSAITHIAIHTVQGSYSGCVSWFQNSSADASAHYVVRSSDGQVTQMVRETDKAWHIGSENPYTLGIEHEGYVTDPSYLTTALYNSSAALTKDMCRDRKIDCNTTYPGPASSVASAISSSYRVKGHQHYPNQTHTDPGQYWDWSKYKTLVSSTTTTPTPTTTVLDSFESGEGHFNTAPTYSGSTTGIATSSTADRATAAKKNGAYGEQIKLVDSTATSANWQVRFLSGSGDPAQNTSLTTAGGKVGFWVYASTSGVTASLGVDDSDGTERSIAKTIPSKAWTWLEWKLDDATQWDAWSGGNGALGATSVTLDAVWFFRTQTSTAVTLFIDDVSYVR